MAGISGYSGEERGVNTAPHQKNTQITNSPAILPIAGAERLTKYAHMVTSTRSSHRGMGYCAAAS